MKHSTHNLRNVSGLAEKKMKKTELLTSVRAFTKDHR